MRSLAMCLIAGLVMTLVGCGKDVPDPGEEVDVTGTVTGVDLSKAKTLKLKLYLMPAGGKARPASFILDSTGKFSGKMVKGTYAFQINGPDGSDTVMKGIPEAIQRGDASKTVEIKGGDVEIKF
jgi:hypothetical protein